MASQKEYSMLFQLNASMNSGFQQTFGKATSSVQEMQKKIQALAKEQADITAYEKQQKAVEATKSKLDMLQKQYDNIQKEIEETGGYSSALENKLLSKQQQIDKTSASLEAQTGKLNQMDAALQESGVDTGHLTEESKRLEGELKELKEKQEEAADAAQEYGERGKESFEAVAGALAAAGIAMALKQIAEAYADCVKLSADFDAAMSQVAATMGKSNDEVSDLAEFAKEMGASTKFTAIEAADGINILAMAGLNANQIMEALPTVLNLASAGAMDLAESAGYVTGAVKGFSDSMENSGYYADLMAKGATMANTNVQQLGEALGASAATASTYGQEAESLTVSLLRLAEQNVTGSQASTMLTRAMADVYTPTAEARKALDELNLTMYDTSTGAAKEFNQVVEEIDTALSGMTQEQQNAYKNTIFTTNGLKAFNMMTAASSETVNKFWDGLKNASGSAGQQAETQLDNLNGAITIMNSSWDGLRTTLGELYSEDLRDLVEIGTELLTGINAFVKANPGLVKGILTTTGVLTGASTAIIGISAAIKVVEAAAVPGIGTVLGAAAAVSALIGGVVALREGIRDSVPAARDLHDATDALTKSTEEASNSFYDTVAGAQATVDVANNYIDKLDEMQEAGIKTTEQQKEYRNICELLKETMPELSETIDAQAATYDIDTEALKKNTEAFLENAKVQAREEYLTEIREKYNDVLKQQAVSEIKLTEAQQKEKDAQENYAKTIERMNELVDQANIKAEQKTKEYGFAVSAMDCLDAEYDKLSNDLQKYSDAEGEALNTQAALQREMKRSAAETAEAEAALKSAEDAIDKIIQPTKEAAEATKDYSGDIALLDDSMQAVMDRLTELSEGYQQAYDSAKDSLSGQYSLWDEVAEVAAVSADTMNTQMQEQAKYWENYNTNLSSLRDRAADIEGLNEVIASFADGSEESVNAVSGMAQASDTELAEMVKNYTELQEQQDAAAENIAQMATGYDEEVKKIQQSTEDMVSGMNLEAEARAAARETIQGYIDQVSGMEENVQGAFRKVYAAGLRGLTGTGSSGTTATVPRASEHYASGTENAEPGLALVGENGPELMMMAGGEKVIPAASTEKILSAGSSGEAGSTAVQVTNHFTIEGNASSETVAQILAAGDALKEFVIDAMSEAEIDKKRRAYD